LQAELDREVVVVDDHASLGLLALKPFASPIATDADVVECVVVCGAAGVSLVPVYAYDTLEVGVAVMCLHVQTCVLTGTSSADGSGRYAEHRSEEQGDYGEATHVVCCIVGGVLVGGIGCGLRVFGCLCV
jgi:hypothetical protein